RRQAADDAARDQSGVSQDLGRVRRGGSRQEPVLQESLRIPEGLCRQGGTGQALHVPALHSAGGLLLARQVTVTATDASRAKGRAASAALLTLARYLTTCGSHRAICGQISSTIMTRT